MEKFGCLLCVRAAMANCEPHGFVFDHVGRHPSTVSSRQRLSTSDVDQVRSSTRSRSSFRISSLRNALFSGAKNRPAAAADKTAGRRSLFGRQGDGRSPAAPGGDLWVDLDLDRPASPSLDTVSVTSADWSALEATPGDWSSEGDWNRSSTEGNVAMVRRSNSARPATRRALPLMRAPVLPDHGGHRFDAASGMTTEPESVWLRSVSASSDEPLSHTGARLSGDSGHVSCKRISMCLLNGCF